MRSKACLSISLPLLQKFSSKNPDNYVNVGSCIYLKGYKKAKMIMHFSESADFAGDWSQLHQ